MPAEVADLDPLVAAVDFYENGYGVPQAWSIGLLTPEGPRLSTCVLIMVVFTSLCPRSFWTALMS